MHFVQRYREPARGTKPTFVAPPVSPWRLKDYEQHCEWAEAQSTKLSVQIAFAAIALTFVFYVYVGVTGGITDGFDRFDGPGESVQQTLADPNYQPPLPPGAWTTGIQ